MAELDSQMSMGHYVQLSRLGDFTEHHAKKSQEAASAMHRFQEAKHKEETLKDRIAQWKRLPPLSPYRPKRAGMG